MIFVILSDFLFLDENGTATTSNAYKLSPMADELRLQVAGSSVDLKVQCMIDTVGDEWADCAVISAADNKTYDSISAAGIYLVPVRGVKRVQVVDNGAGGGVRVYGVSSGEVY